MEVKGKIIAVLPEISGTSKAGNPWKKREYVLETLENYPKKVHFDFFGERADQYPLNVGDTITLSFDIESREYNGRWFTGIRGWKAEKADAAMAGMPVPPAQPIPASAYPGAGAPAAPQAPAPFPGGDGTEDLPF
ncbi:MAG: DUF3127 domain-containing protein [Muribaculaceae bacterium]|nr:DUF3127 domain-containing protein [Muribaculaceae bacterium]